MDKQLLDKAVDAIKNSRIILEDMKKNRSHYSATDLGWRNIDVNIILVETLDMVLSAIIDEDTSTLTEAEIIETEQTVPDLIETKKESILDEDYESVYKKKKPQQPKKQASKANQIRPSSPKVVSKDKKKRSR